MQRVCVCVCASTHRFTPQMPATARYGPGWSQEPIWVFHLDVNDPSTQAIICYLPECALAGSYNGERSPQTSMSDAGIPSSMLMTVANLIRTTNLLPSTLTFTLPLFWGHESPFLWNPARMRLSPGPTRYLNPLYKLSHCHIFKASEWMFMSLPWKLEVWWCPAKLFCDARKAGSLNRSGSANKQDGAKAPTSDAYTGRQLENRWITIIKHLEPSSQLLCLPLHTGRLHAQQTLITAF